MPAVHAEGSIDQKLSEGQFEIEASQAPEKSVMDDIE